MEEEQEQGLNRQVAKTPRRQEKQGQQLNRQARQENKR